MSRILKRPMFRKGGEVMEGIMTGIKPRQNYSLAGRVEDYKNVMRAATAGPSTGPDALTRFLLESGEKLIGGESAGGTKLQEIVGSTKDPMQNYFASLDKKTQQEKSIGLQGAILGIKGQQAIDIAKAKGRDNLQKEFSPQNLRDRLFLERSKETKGYKKDLKQLKPYVTATFDAITRRQLPTIDAFKGKNISYMPHNIKGNTEEYLTDRMIPGTIYFRPDQENFIYERDPEKNIIIVYNIGTGEVIKEIPIGG